MSNKTPEVVAAVDLGSNSFHMIVAKLNDGHLQTIDRMKEMVRLAEGLDPNKRITQDVQTRALDCLERFGQRVRELPLGSVRAVGTNTLRSARKSADFLQRAEIALGHPIEIISGIEEARLIYLGVARSLAAVELRRLVMDIGGGSTELIIGSGSTPLQKESLHLGCVSMSLALFPDGKISSKRMKRAILAANQELEPVIPTFSKSHWQHAVGASGTLRAINKVLDAAGWSNNGITLNGLERLLEAVIDAGHTDRLDLPELSENRRAVFPGGVAITYSTFKSLGIESMQVSDGALREGLLYDLMGRIYHEDVREISVRALAERYHYDQKHADRIIKTIEYCLDQIESPFGLFRKTAQQWLDWAVRLHEIGMAIAHSNHQKHAAYIIEHADIAGFSRQDQKLLATFVRIHRRKFISKLFDELAPPWNTAAKNLSIILRLAIVLHRSRHIDSMPAFKLIFEKKGMDICFEKNWLDSNPLTQADLEQEASYLKAAGFTLQFK